MSAGRDDIFDAPLSRPKQEVTVSLFGLLFSEFIRYNNQYVASQAGMAGELESRMLLAGEHVGLRLLELIVYRERGGRREDGVINVMRTIICNLLWKHLFNQPVPKQNLQRVTNKDNEYMIKIDSPLILSFIEPTACRTSSGTYLAGIIKGVLVGSGYSCQVSAHSSPTDTNPMRTVFYIRLNGDAVTE